MIFLEYVGSRASLSAKGCKLGPVSLWGPGPLHDRRG